MTLIAFDTAIKTGVAVGLPGSAPQTFTVHLGKAEWDVRFARCLRMVEKLVIQHRPELIAVEAPSAGGYTNQDLVGLTICIRAQAARMGVPVRHYHANSVRKFFLGKALSTSRDFPNMTRDKAKGEIKARVMARCRMLGWEVADADAADAAALWSFACHSAGHAAPMPGELFAEGRG